MKTYVVTKKDGTFVRKFYSEVEDPTYYFGNPDEINVELRDSTYEELLDECHRMRAVAYPPVTNLADAIFHVQNGSTGPMVDYLAACQAVKDMYPKPQAP